MTRLFALYFGYVHALWHCAPCSYLEVRKGSWRGQGGQIRGGHEDLPTDPTETYALNKTVGMNERVP